MIKWVDCINARNHPKASVGDVRIGSTKFHNKEYISVSFIEGLAQKITNGDERMMVGFDYNTMKVFSDHLFLMKSDIKFQLLDSMEKDSVYSFRCQKNGQRHY